jgi:hypothetical protein
LNSNSFRNRTGSDPLFPELRKIPRIDFHGVGSGKRKWIVQRANVKFDVVPLSEVPHARCRNAYNAGKQKDGPYAIHVSVEAQPQRDGFVYCTGCELRFSLKRQRHPLPENLMREFWLRCPYCGHLDQYTPIDLLRATPRPDRDSTAIQ